MSDTDEEYPSHSPMTTEYPTYEIDCNVMTVMAAKPCLSVLLNPPEYTDTQSVAESSELPEIDPVALDASPTFQIYSQPLDDDNEEFTNTGIVSTKAEESETSVEYGDYSEDNISDNSLDDLLDMPPSLRESCGHRLPDILDDLTGVEGGTTCRCVSDYLTVTAEKIFISPPADKQNRSTSDTRVIETLNENEVKDETLQEEEGDCNKADDIMKRTDSKEGGLNELTFDEYSFSGLEFQSTNLISKEHKKKYPIRNSVSNIPQSAGLLELTKEERRMIIDEMILLRKDTIKGNRRHSWTGNLKLGKFFCFYLFLLYIRPTNVL